jgi:hypothetical protein
MKEPADFLSIKLLDMEASADGRFAIVALTLIALFYIAARYRR